jgi:hypothetical protein
MYVLRAFRVRLLRRLPAVVEVIRRPSWTNARDRGIIYRSWKGSRLVGRARDRGT